MMVYAEREERVNSRRFLRDLLNSSDPVDRLIRFGQFEAGVVDAVCPETDDWTPLMNALRRAAESAEYACAQTLELPEFIAIRPQEGFAYYAVYPEMYERAARRFRDDCRPQRPLTIGVRSIGTTLSAVVANVVGGDSFTVRPRGHPYDRKLSLSVSLWDRLRQADWVLIVDEGPGLSGSSFTSVAAAAREAGILPERIVVFPSHDPDPETFVSEKARDLWPKLRKYIEPFRAEDYVPPNCSDLSGGQWREYCGVDVEVVAFLERRKYLDAHTKTLWKFEGLGHYGRDKLKRAEKLEDFIPPVCGIRNGFMQSQWIEGTQATEPEWDLLDAVAEYLALLKRECSTGEMADTALLSEVIRVNTSEEVRDPRFETEAVAIDGKMQPYEWIRTTRGWTKTDALDHHNDHLLPGNQDIAWDIAGAAVEFGVPAECIADSYLQRQSDPTLLLRLPFYMQAYRAFRSGYRQLFGLNQPA